MHTLFRNVLVAGLVVAGTSAAFAAPAHRSVTQDDAGFRAAYQATAPVVAPEDARTTGYIGPSAGERTRFDRASALTGG